MTFGELKAKTIRACGTTVLNRQLIENPTEAGFKKILRSCTIPGFQKYICQYFETVLGKTPDSIVDVKIVTEDEPVEVEEIPTEEPVIVTEDEPVEVEETVDDQAADVVEQPTEEPVEEIVETKPKKRKRRKK